MASWQAYIKAATDLGFTKACIVARANYQVVGTTNAQTDIATAWLDGDKQVNENQELLDDWNDKSKATFSFFGKKQNIILRDEDDDFIVCSKNKEVMLARQFKTIWFVVYGTAKPKNAPPTDPGFKGAQDALNQICKNVWDALADGGI